MPSGSSCNEIILRMNIKIEFSVDGLPHHILLHCLPSSSFGWSAWKLKISFTFTGLSNYRFLRDSGIIARLTPLYIYSESFTKKGMAMTRLSGEEVAKHNNKDSCWVLIEYQVTLSL